jgi:phosphatidylinositol alpha-1,6-mannosyltransferase
LKLFALITDAFGGRGGIAKFNRDLLASLAADPGVSSIVALPRLVEGPTGPIPPKIQFDVGGANDKIRFVGAAFRLVLTRGRFDWIICGHLNLLPFAALLKKVCAKKLLLVVHGVEGWREGSAAQKKALKNVDYLIVVSEFSRQRFLKWNKTPPPKYFILPNAVDFTSFAPGPSPGYLIERYRLQGKKVLLTLARLSAEEKYKGIDEVLDSIPLLLKQVPNLLYLVAGDGSDRSRLEQKVRDLGIADHVCFAGHILESEKIDHYRVADAFVMAGWGEGFGIVYLEALACGLPVIGSNLDASQEALLHGRLGMLVDPKQQAQLIDAVTKTLKLSKGSVSPELETFSLPAFAQRCSSIVSELQKVLAA